MEIMQILYAQFGKGRINKELNVFFVRSGGGIGMVRAMKLSNLITE